MRNSLSFLLLISLINLGYGSWTSLLPGQNTFVDYDLENMPLEIRTNSVLGSGDRLDLYFYLSAPNLQDNNWYWSGGLLISFASSTTPQYMLWRCMQDYKDFPSTVPLETDKVWRVTLGRTVSGARQIIVHCNNKVVLNLEVTESLCAESEDWRADYNRDASNVLFYLVNTAGDYSYRPAPAICSAGDYMTENGCQQCGENTYSGDGADTCTSCPKGTISAAGSTSEKACEAAVKISVIPFKNKEICKSGKRKCSVACKVTTDGTLDKNGMKICKLENGISVKCQAATYKKKKFIGRLGKVTADVAGQYVCHYKENGVEKTSAPITLTVKGRKKKNKKKGRK